jgi:hypothetical protein
MHNSKRVYLVYSLRLCAGVLGSPPRLILTTPASSNFIPGNQFFFEFNRWLSEACRGRLGSSHFVGLNASRIDWGKFFGIKGWPGWSFTGWPIPDSLYLRTLGRYNPPREAGGP